MNRASIAKIAYYDLVFVVASILLVFGSLGTAIQTCNIEIWVSAVRPVLGESFVGSLKVIWVCLVMAILFPLTYSFRLVGSAKIFLLTGSAVTLGILILVWSIELAPNC